MKAFLIFIALIGGFGGCHFAWQNFLKPRYSVSYKNGKYVRKRIFDPSDREMGFKVIQYVVAFEIIFFFLLTAFA